MLKKQSIILKIFSLHENAFWCVLCYRTLQTNPWFVIWSSSHIVDKVWNQVNQSRCSNYIMTRCRQQIVGDINWVGGLWDKFWRQTYHSCNPSTVFVFGQKTVVSWICLYYNACLFKVQYNQINVKIIINWCVFVCSVPHSWRRSSFLSSVSFLFQRTV